MCFGSFLRNFTANTRTTGLGRTVSTSLYSNSFPLNRIESLPSNHSLTDLPPINVPTLELTFQPHKPPEPAACSLRNCAV